MIERRIDLRMKYGFRVRGKRIVRGRIFVDDDNKVMIEYDGRTCRTPGELLEVLPNLRAVVTGDARLRGILEMRGFTVEDPDKKKASLHVTVNEKLLEMIREEATAKECTASKLINDILNEHYNTHFE